MVLTNLQAGVTRGTGGWRECCRNGKVALNCKLRLEISGTVSRTVIAPSETIKTRSMFGRCGNSTGEVFDAILESDGYEGLFRGNLVKVIANPLTFATKDSMLYV